MGDFHNDIILHVLQLPESSSIFLSYLNFESELRPLS